jgi:hypothetical protein
VIDPDAAAFAAAYATDPTDDDTLDHHAARLVATWTACCPGCLVWSPSVRFNTLLEGDE